MDVDSYIEFENLKKYLEEIRQTQHEIIKLLKNDISTDSVGLSPNNANVRSGGGVPPPPSPPDPSEIDFNEVNKGFKKK